MEIQQLRYFVAVAEEGSILECGGARARLAAVAQPGNLTSKAVATRPFSPKNRNPPQRYRMFKAFELK